MKPKQLEQDCLFDAQSRAHTLGAPFLQEGQYGGFATAQHQQQCC